ncbi:MAG: addiction module toxin RelE [Acetobacteraceae bacterium]|nr:addiction module toxin RelE [Acetobacteraceae bacterium]
MCPAASIAEAVSRYMVCVIEIKSLSGYIPRSLLRGFFISAMLASRLAAWGGGNPLRVFYAFHPRRTAVLLIGGNKTGDDRFYEAYVPMADDLYDIYLKEHKAEGLI